MVGLVVKVDKGIVAGLVKLASVRVDRAFVLQRATGRAYVFVVGSPGDSGVFEELYQVIAGGLAMLRRRSVIVDVEAGACLEP